ncbi:hypothetical protein [Rhodanobacter sp. DHG33]|uniref:hypothetical protein n=1 Tax=Rhodanobacter sp. DHG33 TaxID=2775921 RepID=UPI00177DCBE7|nr:hypothetical protein [Rhodanobacter sp. DHG33]MBD8897859.1 hypothetical protein [Rhodanobacter sp. DHG33]
MKYETLMLSTLFAACLLVCTSVLGSMLVTQPANAHAVATTSSACTTISSCAAVRG